MLAFCAGGKHTVHGQGLSGDSAHSLKRIKYFFSCHILMRVTYCDALNMFYDLLCRGYFCLKAFLIPYPTAFPYGNGMVLHFYQQQESSTTKTVHKVINKGLKTYV